MQLMAELTQHILPRGVQYIRRHVLYASRTKGQWPDKPHVEESTVSVSNKESRYSWAKLIAQVYETDPLECPRCGSQIQVLALITETEEALKILRNLAKIGRSPPGLDPASLN